MKNLKILNFKIKKWYYGVSPVTYATYIDVLKVSAQ